MLQQQEIWAGRLLPCLGGVARGILGTGTIVLYSAVQRNITSRDFCSITSRSSEFFCFIRIMNIAVNYEEMNSMLLCNIIFTVCDNLSVFLFIV